MGYAACIARAQVTSVVPVLVALAVSSVGSAEAAITIDHKQVGCVVAGRFPRISARIGPIANVARARVYFRAAGAGNWYFVDMRPEGEMFYGALPKPKPTTRQIEYYVQAVDESSAESRTQDYSPVVAGAAECDKKGLVSTASLAKAKVVVHGTASPAEVASGSGAASAGAVAAAAPAGFAAAGIVGVTTGVSAGVVVAGIAGAGAAVAAVAVNAPAGSTTTPAPGPCVTGPSGEQANYVLSGSTFGSTRLLFIDDYANFSLNGQLFFHAEHPPGAPCCNVSPVAFVARSGDQLTVEAGNIGGPYGIGILVVWKNGQCWQQLATSAAPSCTTPFNPDGPNCPTGIYFTQGYALP